MKLWAHQQQAVEFGRKHKHLALFMEAGTGKTGAAINILREEYNSQRRIAPTLIVAPLSVCPQWKKEFALFSKVPQEKILVLTGARDKRIEELTRLMDAGGNGIVATNYEATLIKPFYERLVEWAPKILLIDELHKAKDAASQRSKKLYPLAQAADRRIGLTGTPILNSELDLFGQFKLIDPAIFGGNFFTFRMKYFYDKNSFMPKHIHFPNWQARPETKKELGEIVAKHSIQAKKSECLDLPPFLEIPVEVPLSSKQQKAYEDMQKDFVAEVKNNVSTAEFAMTKTLRLQQILCGFIQPDDADEAVWLDDIPRLDALKETLESIGGKRTIIWTTFRATYPKIKKVCDGLGLTSAFLIGGQSAKQNEQAIQDFRFGDTQVLISNPAAGGTGVNLTEAPYAIYYHKGYSLEHFLQSQARNFRGGSNMHEKVTHYHFFSPNTLDQIIHNCLLDKQDTAMAVLNWAKVIALNMKG